MIDLCIYLQQFFSFCETAESKNKTHSFDTTVVRGSEIGQPLQNEIYSDVSKFHCQEGGNVLTQKPHLTFHKNTEWMKMAASPHY